MDNHANKKVAEEFAGVFATSLTESLTQAVGVPLQLKVLESPDLGTRPGDPVHYRLTVGGALRGECYIELYVPHVAELGARILGKAASAYTEDHAEALGKVIAAAMPGVTAALSAEYGELTFKVDRVGELAFGGMLLVPLAASANEKTSIPVLLYFDGKFLTALSSQTLMQNASATERVPADPANLKLVMDVELNVLLRFGQRQLPLREVLDLASGSIVELDRQVDEPVELLLDGKVIARGEAVIVDGNYGLRVTEIPQPMASHFTS
jgi:flagellar motor switch protein FliN/FliY